jgi:hypothetical protein
VQVGAQQQAVHALQFRSCRLCQQSLGHHWSQRGVAAAPAQLLQQDPPNRHLCAPPLPPARCGPAPPRTTTTTPSLRSIHGISSGSGSAVLLAATGKGAAQLEAQPVLQGPAWSTAAGAHRPGCCAPRAAAARCCSWPQGAWPVPACPRCLARPWPCRWPQTPHHHHQRPAGRRAARRLQPAPGCPYGAQRGALCCRPLSSTDQASGRAARAPVPCGTAPPGGGGPAGQPPAVPAPCDGSIRLSCPHSSPPSPAQPSPAQPSPARHPPSPARPPTPPPACLCTVASRAGNLSLSIRSTDEADSLPRDWHQLAKLSDLRSFMAIPVAAGGHAPPAAAPLTPPLLLRFMQLLAVCAAAAAPASEGCSASSRPTSPPRSGQPPPPPLPPSPTLPHRRRGAGRADRGQLPAQRL